MLTNSIYFIQYFTNFYNEIYWWSIWSSHHKWQISNHSTFHIPIKPLIQKTKFNSQISKLKSEQQFKYLNKVESRIQCCFGWQPKRNMGYLLTIFFTSFPRTFSVSFFFFFGWLFMVLRWWFVWIPFSPET